MPAASSDPPTRQRLDQALVERGLASSRARARDAIRRGAVTVDGEPATRPAAPVSDATAISLDDPAAGYVARSALKLIAGLDRFGYPVPDRAILDLGASTGGFTQVLLERGAARVFAVDVGHGQLDRRVASDPRVTDREGLNGRDLVPADVGGGVDGLTADLSFVSLTKVLTPALDLVRPGGWCVALVKPQFEVGRAGLGKGGVVRDGARAVAAAEGVAAWLAEQAGWRVDGLFASPITGGDGNQEFLLGARRGG